MLPIFQELNELCAGPRCTVAVRDELLPICERLLSHLHHPEISDQDLKRVAFFSRPVVLAETFFQWACGPGIHTICRNGATMAASRRIIEVALHSLCKMQRQGTFVVEGDIFRMWKQELLGYLCEMTLRQSKRSHQSFLSLLCNGGGEAMREVVRKLQSGVLVEDSTLPQRIAAHVSKKLSSVKSILKLFGFLYPELLDFSAVDAKVREEALQRLLVNGDDRLAASLLSFVDKAVVAKYLQNLDPKLFPLTFQKCSCMVSHAGFSSCI